MTAKIRTIAVQVSEETHLLFRMLRASTGLRSADLITRALERFAPEAEELDAEVLADFERHAHGDQSVAAGERAEPEASELNALYLELGINLNGVASNPFP